MFRRSPRLWDQHSDVWYIFCNGIDSVRIDGQHGVRLLREADKRVRIELFLGWFSDDAHLVHPTSSANVRHRHSGRDIDRAYERPVDSRSFNDLDREVRRQQWKLGHVRGYFGGHGSGIYMRAEPNHPMLNDRHGSD